MEAPEIGHAIADRCVMGLPEDAWRKDRKENPSLGASAMAGVLGLGPYGSEWQTWAEVTKGHQKLTTDEMRLGNLLEPHIRRLASERIGFAIREVPWVLRHPAVSCMTTNLDGIIPGWEQCFDTMVVELKLTNWRNRDAWEALECTGDPRAVVGTSVGQYWVQVQAQLAITGLEGAYLVGLVDDNGAGMRALSGLPVRNNSLIVIQLERDDAFIDKMESHALWWWEEYVVGNKAPPVIERDLAELRRFFSEAYEGKSVDLPGLREDVGDYVIHRGNEKESKILKQACAARIMAAMGDAEVATIGGERVTWKKTKKGKRVLRVP